MMVVGVVALGAGAFVTTTVAATLIIKRRTSSPVDEEEWVQVDMAEKGLSDGPDVDDVEAYQAKRGEGWKEYIAEEQEKVVFEPGVLAPLFIHDELAAHASDLYPETRAPNSPERIFPTSLRWPKPPQTLDAPDHIPSPQRSPALEPAVPLLEEAMTHVPAGSPMMMTSITSGPLAEPEIPSGGIISWPAISSTPDDTDEPVSPSNTLTPVPRVTSTLQLELIPPTPLALEPLSLPPIISPLSIKTPIIQWGDDASIRPVIDIKTPIDPAGSFRSPSAQSPSEDDLLPPPPVYTRYDTAKSPIDQTFVENVISPLVQTFAAVNVFIIDEAALAARVPLPLSIPPTPKPVGLKESLVEDTCSGGDMHGSHDLKSLDSIHSPTTPDSDSDSPISDIDSELLSLSSIESSAPNTPIERREPISPMTDTEDDPVDGPLTCTPDTTEPDDDIRICEVMNVPDDINEPFAPDPPDIAVTPIPLVPGSFDRPLAVSRTPEAAMSVSLLTGDVVQLCRAILAVSNCAGLVAQFVVGFSVWWSLILVPV
ncbi:hypothetical protein RhiJN_26662 [Ceratobasidium sp. AG-Ba]|nr:hypothetical protein RhiJN_26662 [Ceratobasidium sp. AG-Ba]